MLLAEITIDSKAKHFAYTTCLADLAAKLRESAEAEAGACIIVKPASPATIASLAEKGQLDAVQPEEMAAVISQILPCLARQSQGTFLQFYTVSKPRVTYDPRTTSST
jgi:hypothetical protein